MTIQKLITTFCLLLITTCFAQAQSTVTDIFKEWKRARAYTKEYLDVMPDSGYRLKPTVDMRSFAEQLLHLSDINYVFGAAATGEKSLYAMGEAEKTTDKSKANVSKIVLAGYDLVINGIKKMSPAQLNEKVTLFGKFDLTKRQVLEKAFEHQTHHRGQATVYLRLAGVKPPQEKLF